MTGKEALENIIGEAGWWQGDPTRTEIAQELVDGLFDAGFLVMEFAPKPSGDKWLHLQYLAENLSIRCDELLARSEKQSDDGAHDLAKLTAFRAMGVVDSISLIRSLP